MRISIFPIFILLTATHFCFADWLCREAASTSSGNLYTVCGIGEGASLQEAREKALSAAKLEFEKLCSISVDCRDYEAVAKPLRTDCLPEKLPYKCYRGLEFIVTSIKKRNIIVDENEIQTQIAQKKEELAKLYETINANRTLASISSEITIAMKEVEIMQSEQRITQNAGKDTYSSPLHPWLFGLGVGFGGSTVSMTPSFAFDFSMPLSKRLSNWFGIESSTGFLYGFGGNALKTITSGQQHQTFENHYYAFQLSIKPKFYIDNTYFYPEAGYSTGKLTQGAQATSNGPIGTQDYFLSQYFFGAGIGYELSEVSKYHVGLWLGLRNYGNSGSLSGTKSLHMGFKLQ